MDIRKESQYNQPVGKYKILSSAAGVGSIITTKWGGFIMPLSIDNWKFLEVVTNKIKEILPNKLDIKKIQDGCGVELIEDPRFVEFLAIKKGRTATPPSTGASRSVPFSCRKPPLCRFPDRRPARMSRKGGYPLLLYPPLLQTQKLRSSI